MANTTHVAPTPGCYIDSHHGHYTLPAVIRLAVKQGMRIDPFAEFVLASYDEHYPDEDYPTEALYELGDEAVNWLNDNNAPRGHAWGYNDGDFGLYPLEED